MLSYLLVFEQPFIYASESLSAGPSPQTLTTDNTRTTERGLMSHSAEVDLSLEPLNMDKSTTHVKESNIESILKVMVLIFIHGMALFEQYDSTSILLHLSTALSLGASKVGSTI